MVVRLVLQMVDWLVLQSAGLKVHQWVGYSVDKKDYWKEFHLAVQMGHCWVERMVHHWGDKMADQRVLYLADQWAQHLIDLMEYWKAHH